jgi:hypothetical protein
MPSGIFIFLISTGTIGALVLRNHAMSLPHLENFVVVFAVPTATG